MSNSQEEEIARDYICFGKPDTTIIILDGTCIEKNLNLVFQILEITNKVVICVNLLDEAKKKGIEINLKKLSELLGVPVVGTIARKPKTLNKLLDTVCKVANNEIICNSKPVKYLPIIEDCILMLKTEIEKLLPSEQLHLSRWISLKLIEGDICIINSIENALNISLSTENILSKLSYIHSLLEKNDIFANNLKDKMISSIIFHAENICTEIIFYKNASYPVRDRKIDKILTSKKFGIPIMIAFLGIVFWITITGANYPSHLLSNFFGFIEQKLFLLFNFINAPDWITGLLINGLYKTVTWVVAVMLPPMAIFFPLFTILEDLGYLPRIAFNLDNYFKKACTSGKQALTMCMGFGCNAARSCWLPNYRFSP